MYLKWCGISSWWILWQSAREMWDSLGGSLYIHTLHTYIHTYIHTCMHTYTTYMHTHIHTYIHTYTTYMYTYIHTYTTCIHIYMHTYIQTCIHTYRCTWTTVHQTNWFIVSWTIRGPAMLADKGIKWVLFGILRASHKHHWDREGRRERERKREKKRDEIWALTAWVDQLQSFHQPTHTNKVTWQQQQHGKNTTTKQNMTTPKKKSTVLLKMTQDMARQAQSGLFTTHECR